MSDHLPHSSAFQYESDHGISNALRASDAFSPITYAAPPSPGVHERAKRLGRKKLRWHVLRLMDGVKRTPELATHMREGLRLPYQTVVFAIYVGTHLPRSHSVCGVPQLRLLCEPRSDFHIDRPHLTHPLYFLPQPYLHIAMLRGRSYSRLMQGTFMPALSGDASLHYLPDQAVKSSSYRSSGMFQQARPASQLSRWYKRH